MLRFVMNNPMHAPNVGWFFVGVYCTRKYTPGERCTYYVTYVTYRVSTPGSTVTNHEPQL